MFIYSPRRPNGLVVVTDARSRYDMLCSQRHGHTHVLEGWPLGGVLGAEWRNTTRIALFEYGHKPLKATKGSISEAQREASKWRQWLAANKPKCVVILPTPTAGQGEKGQENSGTVCWTALGAPDGVGEMRGAFWLRDGTYYVPLFPWAKRIKELQRWASGRWLQWAAGIAKGHLQPVTCDLMSSTPDEGTCRLLDLMAGRPIAIDLETIPNQDKVTAIGVSDGIHSVSIPMDRFLPFGREDFEPGIKDFQLCAEITHRLRNLFTANTLKLYHNMKADAPLLEARGFVLNGPTEDTYPAHAIAFPELRHGLQHAVASLMPAPPWKSLYKPEGLKGITRDDPEYWTCDPEKLRVYNAEDAFFTVKLAELVLPAVGIPWASHMNSPT